jgi:hypothetical protein
VPGFAGLLCGGCGFSRRATSRWLCRGNGGGGGIEPAGQRPKATVNQILSDREGGPQEVRHVFLGRGLASRHHVGYALVHENDADSRR